MVAASLPSCYLASLLRDFIADLNAVHESEWGNGDIVPLATNFGSRWRRVVSFANWLLYRRQKKPPIPTRQEAARAQQHVWSHWNREKPLASAGNWIKCPRVSSPWHSHYTDYAILKPKSGRHRGSLCSNNVRSTASNQALQSTLNSKTVLGKRIIVSDLHSLPYVHVHHLQMFYKLQDFTYYCTLCINPSTMSHRIAYSWCKARSFTP